MNIRTLKFYGWRWYWYGLWLVPDQCVVVPGANDAICPCLVLHLPMYWRETKYIPQQHSVWENASPTNPWDEALVYRCFGGADSVERQFQDIFDRY